MIFKNYICTSSLEIFSIVSYKYIVGTFLHLICCIKLQMGVVNKYGVQYVSIYSYFKFRSIHETPAIYVNFDLISASIQGNLEWFNNIDLQVLII